MGRKVLWEGYMIFYGMEMKYRDFALCFGDIESMKNEPIEQLLFPTKHEFTWISMDGFDIICKMSIFYVIKQSSLRNNCDKLSVHVILNLELNAYNVIVFQIKLKYI